MATPTRIKLFVVPKNKPELTQAGAFLLAASAVESECGHAFRTPDLYQAIASNRLKKILPEEMEELLDYDGYKKPMDPSTVLLTLCALRRGGLLRQDGNSFSLTEQGEDDAEELRRLMGYELEDIRQAVKITMTEVR